jgi:hypothetical protein
MNPEAFIASEEAREPLYTEGDFVRRFAEIKKACAIGIMGGSAEKVPDGGRIALLASGRVSDAEYFRLAGSCPLSVCFKGVRRSSKGPLQHVPHR